MKLKTFTGTLSHVVRLTLLSGVISVSSLDLHILNTNYSRGYRPSTNSVQSPVLMTCGVPDSLRCERVCTMTSGCKSFFYSPCSSTCQFHGDVFNSPADESNHNTASHDGLYYYKNEDGENEEKQEPWTRILFGPDWKGNKWVFLQRNIQSHQTTVYPYLRKPDKIYSIAYLPMSRRLLVSFRQPETIWRAPVDSSDNWSVVANDSATNMGVDEGRQLLIFTGIHKNKIYLGKIQLGCNHLQKIIENTWFDSLAVFPSRQLICASTRNRIMFVSYEGQVLRTVGTGLHTRVVPNLSPGAAHVLYCCQSNYLMKMSFSKMATDKVIALSGKPSFVLHDGNNTIYVASLGDIWTIDVLNSKVQDSVAIRNYDLHILVLL